MAKARDGAFESVYKALDEKGGDRLLHRLARDRVRERKDVDRVKCIKNEDDEVLVDELQIKGRSQRYFSGLLNEGFRSPDPGHTIAGQTDISFYRRISKKEIEEAVRKMKYRRTVGPDEIPLEVWKCLGAKGLEWLTSFFNVVFRSARMSGDWRLSRLIPVYKHKGDEQLCGSYRDIKLLSHTMKI